MQGIEIDVRSLPKGQRHAFIFQAFDAIPSPGFVELINDHDPLGLKHQFEEYRNSQFSWEYLTQGPDEWRVRISKTAHSQSTETPQENAQGGCCGFCVCKS